MTAPPDRPPSDASSSSTSSSAPSSASSTPAALDARLAEVALRSGRLGSYVRDLDAEEMDLDAPFREVLGLPADRPGTVRTVDAAVHPQDRATLRALVRDVVEGRADGLDAELRVADADDRWVHVFGRVTEQDGRRLLVGVVQDVTQRRRSEDDRERLARELALSEARYRTLVEASSLGVFRAAPDGTTLNEIDAWRRLTGGSITGWGWLDDVHPHDRETTRAAWCTAVTSGDTYDHTYRVVTVSGAPMWMHARAVPVRVDPDDPTSPVLEWVGTVDDVTDVVQARRGGEAVRESAEALARALGVDEVVHALHHVAAGALGAHASVVALTLDDGTVVDQHGYGGAEGTVVDPDASVAWPLLHRVGRDGEALFVRSPDDLRALTAATPGAAKQVDLAIAQGEVSWAVLPMRYGPALLGAIRFGFTEPHAFEAGERDTLHAIAAQHAAALVRARLYEAERETSLTLQQALAPQVPSRVNGMDVAMRYQPAGAHAQVGGDWVDALALPDGRVCLVVGDVMGSGIPAAATMGRLRTALTALALHEHDPARLLADLDAMLLPGDLLATVGLAVVDAAAGTVDVYSAGHLPVLLAGPSPDDVRFVEPARMPPVGVGWSRNGGPPEPVRVALAPGTVVALCTDGLVETRADAIDVRLETWRRCVADRVPLGASRSLVDDAAALVAAMDAEADDDVTLLLARLPDG